MHFYVAFCYVIVLFITVIFRYYTVSMYDVGNYNIWRSAAERRKNVGNFPVPGECLYEGQKH